MSYENEISNDTDYLLKYPSNKSDVDNLINHSTMSLVNKSIEDIMKTDIQHDISIKLEPRVVTENIEDMLLTQDEKIIKLHAKLYSLFVKANDTDSRRTILISLGVSNKELIEFIKVFENYCYFIRLYEHQLYCSNNDKYIKFLIDSIVDIELEGANEPVNFKLLKDVILNFNYNPKNIYMRLSWYLYQKEHQSITSIFKKWRTLSSVRHNLQKLHNIWIEKIQRKTLNIFIKKYNKEVDERNGISDLFYHKKILIDSCLKWKQKTLLLEKFIIFGEELVKERIMKNILREKLKHLNLMSINAENFYHGQLKRKIILLFMKSINHLKNENALARIHLDTTRKSHFLINIEIKNTDLRNMTFVANSLSVRKSFRSLCDIANSRILADEFYFKTLKLHHWNEMLVAYKLSTFKRKQQVITKVFIIDTWAKKTMKQQLMIRKADIKFETRDTNLYKILIFNKLENKLNVLSNLNNIFEENKLFLSKSTIIKCFQSWNKLSQSIKINKLEFMLNLFFKQTHHLNIKYNFLQSVQNSITTKNELSITAEEHYHTKLKKKVIFSFLSNIENLKSQAFIADKYKEKRAASNVVLNMKIKYSLINDFIQLSSVYTDRKLYKNVKRIITNWNLKLLKIKNMSSALDTHSKRWKRAELRGIISLWQDQMHLAEQHRAQLNSSGPDLSLFSEKLLTGDVVLNQQKGFNELHDANIYVTPEKKIQSRRQAIDYLNSKNLEIQERRRFYQGSMKKKKMNANEMILKPSPIKTSKTLSRTMKKKLNFDSTFAESDTYSLEEKTSLKTENNRNHILSKYKLDEYSLPINQSPFFSKTKNLTADHTDRDVKINAIVRDNMTIASSSPIKKRNSNLGEIPNLSKSKEFNEST